MKLFEKQVFIALSSKEQNIQNRFPLQFPDFSMGTWFEIFQMKQKLKKWSLKTGFCCKKFRNMPQKLPKLFIQSLEMDPIGFIPNLWQLWTAFGTLW